MLLLWYSNFTYQDIGRGGGQVTPEPVVVEPPVDDDDMLMVWFTYLARYYAKN